MNPFKKTVLVSLALFASATALFAAKPIPGPKGGKIVTKEAPHVEFFVTKDRAVIVSFYDQNLKAVPASGQVVTAIAEAKTGKTNLNFAVKDGALVSTSALPEGDGYRIVLQVRDTAEARPKNYRVEFHDEACGECKRAEYACVCEDAGAHAGHSH